MVVFAVGLVVAALISVWFFNKISPSFGKSQREVKVEVSTVFGVFEGFDEVRFRGVRAGTIEKIERDGAQPVLDVKIEKQYGPIYQNARAELRPVTPLNDIYLDIVDPGTPDAGEVTTDQPLDVSRTTTSVGVPDVVDALGADEQRNLHILLDELGNGTADGGQSLRQAFVELEPFLEAAGRLTHQIAIRKETTKRLIHNAGILTGALGERETQLRDLIGSGSQVFATLQARNPELDSTLAQLGPTFNQITDALVALDGGISDIDAGVMSLYPVADRLGPGLAAARNLNSALGPAITRLRPTVTRLMPLVQALQPASQHLDTSFSYLQPQLPVIDRVFKDLADCEKGVVGFFQWNVSTLGKYGDQNGLVPRGNLAFGIPALGAPGEPLREFEQDTCVPGPIPRGVVTDKDTH
jgi:phospholipid/cholesterol/gamma-HCH transport system substrate-binding protein